MIRDMIRAADGGRDVSWAEGAEDLERGPADGAACAWLRHAVALAKVQVRMGDQHALSVVQHRDEAGCEMEHPKHRHVTRCTTSSVGDSQHNPSIEKYNSVERVAWVGLSTVDCVVVDLSGL